MALTDAQRSRLIELAKERGLDPDAAVRAAEGMSTSGGSRQTDPAGKEQAAHPVADRMLIGFIPWPPNGGVAYSARAAGRVGGPR